MSIENFAIIDRVQLDFHSGMSVLSGETGAGKSIIIDALGLLCGGRGSHEFIRTGQEKLAIEGLFTFDTYPRQMVEILNEFGIETDLDSEDLLIRREINQSGKNIIRVNGQLANVSLLKDLGEYIADIHGQNEHQALLDSSRHLSLLDRFAGKEFQDKLIKYRHLYDKYRHLREEYQQTLRDDEDQSQRLSFLEFQINEIEAAELVEGELEELQDLSKRMQNAQLMARNAYEINSLMSDSDYSILSQWESLLELIETNQTYEPAYEEAQARLTSLRYEVEDVAQFLANIDLSIDDNQSLDDVEGRLGQLSALQRKYKMDIGELIQYYQDISEEIYHINHRELYLSELSEKVVNAYQDAFNQAEQLTEYRQSVSKRLKEEIETELKDLYMPDSQFSVKFHPTSLDKALSQVLEMDIYNLTPNGKDALDFFVVTNIGEAAKPLVQVASGGELSRYMLALKTVFARQDASKTMVFDEIDTGVSGRVAQSIARKMKSISEQHQVLAITHLPQVAAIADHQIHIRKLVDQGRTHTKAHELSFDERTEMISMMMSGQEITKASLLLAEELLTQYGHGK